MGTVIAVTSGKGGTGKTTVTGGVASCLAQLGRKVLCIDMDIGLRNLDISLGLSDRALVVATNDASSLRDAQRTVEELSGISQVHLVMNRIQPKLLRQLRTTIDDAMDSAGLPLMGVIPEDRRVILAGNLGRPLILEEGRRGAGQACFNIARRIEGYRVPIMRIR